MARSVLVYSIVPTHPLSQGNHVRIFRMCEAMRQLGHRVHLLYVPTGRTAPADMGAMERYWGDRLHVLELPKPSNGVGRRWRRLRAGVLRRWHNPGQYLRRVEHKLNWLDEWYLRPIGDEVCRLQDELGCDTVLCEYVFMSKGLTGLPAGVRRVIDTHDAFGLRAAHIQAAGLVEGMWFSLPQAHEARGLARADAVIAIEAGEAEYFRSLGVSSVHTVGHLIDVGAGQPGAGNGSVLFVGSANYLNAGGVRWLAEEVVPRVDAMSDEPVRFELAGGICGEAEASGYSRLVLHGRVEDLSPLYRDASVVINPVRAGTGLAIKSVEALGWGRPLLTTQSGARGLGSPDGKGFRVCDDADGFARELVDLLGDVSERERLGAEAKWFAEGYCVEQLAQLQAALGVVEGSVMQQTKEDVVGE
ncbi:MAG: glycosyltransferase [Planctomycetota bacterium]